MEGIAPEASLPRPPDPSPPRLPTRENPPTREDPREALMLLANKENDGLPSNEEPPSPNSPGGSGEEGEREEEGGEGGEKVTEEKAVEEMIQNLRNMPIEEITKVLEEANLSPEDQQKLLKALEGQITSPDLDEAEAEEEIPDQIKKEPERQKEPKQSKKRQALEKVLEMLKLGFSIVNKAKEVIKKQEQEEDEAVRERGKKEREENPFVRIFLIMNRKNKK